MTEKPVPPRRNRAFRTYFEASENLRDMLGQHLRREHSLSMSDFNILLLLDECEDRMRMSDLAEKMIFRPSRLTYAVQSLQKRGLVDQEPCATDRRVHYVFITDKGREIFRRARATHREQVDGIFLQAMSEEDLEALERIFTPLLPKG